MIILGHRAQEKVVPKQFGVELDLRWDHTYEGIILSHEATTSPEYKLSDWLDWDRNANRQLRPCYAFNIKEDGLEESLRRIIDEYQIKNYFVFDMSFPSGYIFRQLGINTADRISDLEFWPQYSGTLWVDRWNWSTHKVVSRALPMGGADYIWLPSFYDGKKTQIYMVSPELHCKVEPEQVVHHWRCWWDLGIDGICTDFWWEAQSEYERHHANMERTLY